MIEMIESEAGCRRWYNAPSGVVAALSARWRAPAFGRPASTPMEQTRLRAYSRRRLSRGDSNVDGAPTGSAGLATRG